VSSGVVTAFSVVEAKQCVYLGGSIIRELDDSSPPNVLKKYVGCGCILVV